VLKCRNLDAIECGVVGVFIAPTTTKVAVGGLLSHGAPDSPVRQPTSADRWGSTVELWLVGPPGCPVAHWTSPVDCPVCHPRVPYSSACTGAH
jgi:hypothetical protein